MIENPYQVLGVSRDASSDEIKRAYRKLAKKYEVKLSALRSVAEREKWVELKAQAQHKTDTKIVDAVSDIEADRAAKIKEGSYDFALDEVEGADELLDIPEELEETEEDRLLDERDARLNKKFDKILTWASVGVIIAAVGFLIYYFLA